jgi:hypothetical protein
VRPTPSFEWPDPQVEALAHHFTVDHEEATVPSYAAGWFQVPGKGHLRHVPNEVIALMFGREWSLEISLSAGGGISHEWTGTITRGIDRRIEVDPMDDTETGTALTTIRDAWSARLVPPETEEPEYRSPVTRLRIRGEVGDVFFSSDFRIDHPVSVVYFARPNVWAIDVIFSASIGEVDALPSAGVTSSGSAADVEGLTVSGRGWNLSDAFSAPAAFEASIKALLWLA